MLENVKCRLEEFFASKKPLIKSTAIITAVTIAITALITLSVKTFKIFDGEKVYTVRSFNTSVVDAIDGLSLKLDKYKIMHTNVDNLCTNVEIAYTFPVHITRGDNTVTVDFVGGTVEQALNEAGYQVDQYDFVEPKADTVITKTTYIDYTDIDYVSGSYKEVIPHKTENVYSNCYKNGTVTVKEGCDGVQEVKYTEKIVNGVSQGKTVTSVNVVSAMVNTQKIFGTHVISGNNILSTAVKCVSTLKPSAPIELNENGIPVKYKSMRKARATAYTYTGNNCSTGVAPQPGYIAVNPKVIPYGTKMYIKSSDGKYIYGYAVAADTGGFIKKYPTGVDLFMATRSDCVNFGVRTVEIYILE